jgi:predicted RNase H-like HicB family nuclease
MNGRVPLDAYLRRAYSFNAVAVADGGWFVWFPDLPGCMTQADRFAEVGEMAEDAFRAWVTDRYDAGLPIPDPVLAADDVPTPEWDTAGVTSPEPAGVAT